ncbi:hypothetical protein B0H13DRAFT_2303663 [Mycena leptocephala]|nr:hypothetical protein B0H13DRAFT_2303663 [Mycena leptocephala]
MSRQWKKADNNDRSIDIRGIDKLALTKALWERCSYAPAAARFGTNRPWDSSEMNKITDFKFNYLFGKEMKVDLNGDNADPSRYDRDVGAGEFDRIATSVRNQEEGSGTGSSHTDSVDDQDDESLV